MRRSSRRRPSPAAALTALGLICGLLTAAQPASATVPARTAAVTYTADTATLANPERGFYHHTGDCDRNDLSANTLRGYRANQGVSLVMCVFYLADHRDGPIAQAALTQLEQQLATVRSAGLKMILRFAYTATDSGADAAKARVLAHLDQLEPVLTENADVIAVMQAGFVGSWGEWYYTQNFGNAGRVTATDRANRKEVVDKILEVLPRDRMVQLRTPAFKRTMYGTATLPPSQAYDGSAEARLGHHNDCFLASANDLGTYTNTRTEYPYLEAETRFLAMGGETCAPNAPRSGCATAQDELSRFHYSYMNTDYHPDVVRGWSSGGCLEDVKRRLGYRLTLRSGTYPATATAGEGMPISITLRNDGYAAPFNPREAELILRDASGDAVRRIALDTDPREWAPGATVTVSETVALPVGLAAGKYELLLSLPDPETGLDDRPEYSIRLANKDTWEAGTGYNDLLHTVTVS